MKTNWIRIWLGWVFLLTALAVFGEEWFAPFQRVSDYRPKGPTHCFRQFNIDWSWINQETRQIPDFLSEADPVALAEFCQRMNIDGTVVMAVPHHGYCTHETRAGVKFPGLKGDWFGRTIEELHKRRIAAFGYVTLNWNWKYMREHAGQPFIHAEFKPDGTWIRGEICLNAPGYLELVEAYTREVMEDYPVDGMRWDILKTASGCLCDGCAQLHRRLYGEDLVAWKGGDPRRAQDFYLATITRAVTRLRALCKQLKPSVEIWQNSISSYVPIHLDLAREMDLAYNEYGDPFRLLFIRGVADKLAAINGLMNQAPTEPPVAIDRSQWRACLALGGRCYSYYGHKQTNPRTGLPGETMQAWHREQLATFYDMVSQIQPWLEDARPVADLGIVFSEATRFRWPDYDRQPYILAMEQIANARLARNLPPEFINRLDLPDPRQKSGRFKLLVLPLTSGLSAEELEHLRNYVRAGGNLLVGGDALRHDLKGNELKDFALASELGVRFHAAPLASNSHWTASGQLVGRPIKAEGKTLVEVQAVEGETLLSAHRGSAFHPLLHVRPFGRGRMAYLASLDSLELTQQAMDFLTGPAPLAVQPLESRVFLTRQEQHRRWILHLLDDRPCTVEIRRDFAAPTRIAGQFPASGWECALEKTATGLRIKTGGASNRLLVLE